MCWVCVCVCVCVEQYFHHPEEFFPERWLLEDRDNPLYGECVCVCV